MAQDDLDAFLYGRRSPPRAGPAPPPGAPPPVRGSPRPRREPRARRLPRIALPPDWRNRLKAAALLCGAASLALTLLFLFSCGDRDPRGFCRPGPGGLGALGDAGKAGQMAAAAALSAGAGGGVGILLGPPRGSARLAGALWLGTVWILYFAYIAGLLGDPGAPERPGPGTALYQNLTNASSTQGWLIALPYQVDGLLLGGRLGFPAALAAPVAFAVAGGVARLAGRGRSRGHRLRI